MCSRRTIAPIAPSTERGALGRDPVGIAGGLQVSGTAPQIFFAPTRMPADHRGRVKTCASQENVEPFSLLPSSNSRRQHF